MAVKQQSQCSDTYATPAVPLCGAEMLVTLEPLPFANAEGPLKVLPTQQHAQTGSNLVQDSARQASSLSHNPGQSAAGRPAAPWTVYSIHCWLASTCFAL